MKKSSAGEVVGSSTTDAMNGTYVNSSLTDCVQWVQGRGEER